MRSNSILLFSSTELINNGPNSGIPWPGGGDVIIFIKDFFL